MVALYSELLPMQGRVLPQRFWRTIVPEGFPSSLDRQSRTSGRKGEEKGEPKAWHSVNYPHQASQLFLDGKIQTGVG